MPDETIEYESPTPGERVDMEAPRDVVDDGPLPPKEEALRRLAEREMRQKKREDEILRTTALTLAVQWTASERPAVDDAGSLFGLADLMVQYIQTGKKPTETETIRAQKPYRR